MNTFRMDDKEMLNRRARLRELIAVCFDDRDENLLSYIEERTGKRPNQGELSAIQKDHGSKSFGDKKAKILTDQIGLNRRWFDMPPGTNLDKSSWMNPETPTMKREIDPIARMVAMQGVALNAVLLALSKQPGIDVEKLTNDIHNALLTHEVSSENKPEGASAATSSDHVVVRALLHQVLPNLPIL